MKYDLKLNVTSLSVDGVLDLELFENGGYAAGWKADLHGEAVRRELIRAGWTPPPPQTKAPPCWPFSE